MDLLGFHMKFGGCDCSDFWMGPFEVDVKPMTCPQATLTKFVAQLGSNCFAQSKKMNLQRSPSADLGRHFCKMVGCHL